MIESQDIQKFVDEVCEDFVENPDNWTVSLYEIVACGGNFNGLYLQQAAGYEKWGYKYNREVFSVEQSDQLTKALKDRHEAITNSKRKELWSI